MSEFVERRIQRLDDIQVFAAVSLKQYTDPESLKRSCSRRLALDVRSRRKSNAGSHLPMHADPYWIE
jgi:hypothetical protein